VERENKETLWLFKRLEGAYKKKDIELMTLAEYDQLFLYEAEIAKAEKEAIEEMKNRNK
jgi:hypothetical protein